MATDQTGKTLLWASYSGGVVGSHAWQRMVSQPGALSRIETQRCAHAILTDTSNRFAFVPHTGPNAVYQFRFDAKSGKLTKNDPLTASPATGLEPRHLAFHPKLPIVYCDDEKGDSVTAYHFNRETGQLKAFHKSSTLPAGFDGSQKPVPTSKSPGDGFFTPPTGAKISLCRFFGGPQSRKTTSIGQFATGKRPLFQSRSEQPLYDRCRATLTRSARIQTRQQKWQPETNPSATHRPKGPLMGAIHPEQVITQ
ncbi:MAG: hypothetical protein CM1200mP29_17690 [Verrucomicrobiota bacterium]|nr:MAG: hypothetical protein CM1200mP29_17690 [Verrucomicrobiota bacterium]